MTIAEAILRDFDVEAEYSRAVLDAVPDDRLAWKPHEKSMSLGELAGHVAEAPMWVQSMLEDHFDLADAGGGDYRPFVPAGRDELLAALEENATIFREALDGRDDEFMQATWTMSSNGETVMTQPRDAAIRSIMLHHVSHHRGQLTVYLRLLGVAVPQTYGPTADYPDSF